MGIHKMAGMKALYAVKAGGLMQEWLALLAYLFDIKHSKSSVDLAVISR
jgi:hypothetical protein